MQKLDPKQALALAAGALVPAANTDIKLLEIRLGDRYEFKCNGLHFIANGAPPQMHRRRLYEAGASLAIKPEQHN